MADYAALIRPTNYKPLTLLRRPAISLGAGAAHQHCPLGIAQAVRLEKGLDGLLVIDDGERARPVRPPQAAIETPGIEHTGKRVPNIRERIWLPGERAGAADLDHRVRSLATDALLRRAAGHFCAEPLSADFKSGSSVRRRWSAPRCYRYV